MTKKIIDFMTTLILILVIIFMAAALFSCDTTAEEAKISDEGTETIIVENVIVENTLVE